LLKGLERGRPFLADERERGLGFYCNGGKAEGQRQAGAFSFGLATPITKGELYLNFQGRS
jgi:hypothetical protein